MNDLKRQTLVLHAGHEPDQATNSRAVPIYQTTSYVFDSTEHAKDLFELKKFGNIYTRLMNPTTDVLEKRLAALEGGTGALVTSSGMAAIFLAITTVAKAGDHIIASASLYGGTETLFRYSLKDFGIDVTFIDDMTAEKLKNAVKPNTKIVFLETIGNPKGDVLDIESITKTAHEHGLPVFIDNTFAPGLCRVFDYGVDVCLYSCTKWIGGHGVAIGGAIIDSGRFDWSQGRHSSLTEPDSSYHGLKYWDVFGNLEGMGNIAFIIKARVVGLRNFGMCASPFNSFLHIQGLETLPLRMKAHCDNALELAEWLSNHELVSWVNYTGLKDHPYHQTAKKYLNSGFGSVLGFGVKGGAEEAEKFINNVKLCSHLANVGDARTLVLHPSSTSHQQLSVEAKKACGITDDFVRVAVGIEHIEDIKADIDQALRTALS